MKSESRICRLSIDRPDVPIIREAREARRRAAAARAPYSGADVARVARRLMSASERMQEVLYSGAVRDKKLTEFLDWSLFDVLFAVQDILNGLSDLEAKDLRGCVAGEKVGKAKTSKRTHAPNRKSA